MADAIGIDVQPARTAVALLDWSGDQARAGSVGDGRRTLIPNTWTASGWGSAAAEEILAGLDPGTSPLTGQLLAWRRSPWSAEFFGGLRDRLFSYLGQTPPDRTHGHQVCACADPQAPGTPGEPELLRLSEAAGLTDLLFVRPADALMCRWLAEAATASDDGADPAGSSVLAAACGTESVTVAWYTLQRSGRSLVVARGPAVRVNAGCASWDTDFAAHVLNRCREGVPPTALLGLLDGVAEFAAMVRAQGSAQQVEWCGPLAERMFAPLRLTGNELASTTPVARVTSEIRLAAAETTQRAGGARPTAVLVGGPGAAWPFIGDALVEAGPVWGSAEPELDLAVGAAWWTHLGPVFSSPDALPSKGRPADVQAPLPEPTPAVTAGRLSAFAGAAEEARDGASTEHADLSELPPWKR